MTPQATRAIFLGALAIDLLLVFVLLTLTGGGDSLFYLLFFPLVAVNAYYFGPWVGLSAALVAGALYTLSAWLMPPWVGWTPAMILAALVGLPAVTLGLVAERERGARSEVERLNSELTGTLTRLQAAQEELLVAERMATVGRLSLKVAHEVRNPTFARFPRPHFEEESVNDLVRELADFIRPVATRQGLTVRVETDPDVPLLEIDRGLLRQACLNLVKNGLEALSRGGELTLTSRRDGEAVELTIADSGNGIPDEVGKRLFEPFFTTKPQGTGLGLSITRQITEEHGGEIRWTSRPGSGTRFTIRLPLRKVHA